MLSLFAGLLAGAAHVIAGPDHWVAVTPLSIAQPKKAVYVGMKWGAGHAVGILFLGALGLAMRDIFSLDEISSVAEGLVGIVLVISGLWALQKSRTIVIHSHPHHHEHEHEDEHENALSQRGSEHEHVHLHVGEVSHESKEAHQRHGHAAFGFGLLHGVAGASQLWALIPTLALPRSEAISYLIAFLISSIIAMVGFTYMMGRLVSHDQLKLDLAFRVVGWGSIVLGVYWTSLAFVSS